MGRIEPARVKESDLFMEPDLDKMHGTGLNDASDKSPAFTTSLALENESALGNEVVLISGLHADGERLFALSSSHSVHSGVANMSNGLLKWVLKGFAPSFFEVLLF